MTDLFAPESCCGMVPTHGWQNLAYIEKQQSENLQPSLGIQFLVMQNAQCCNLLDRVYGLKWLTEPEIRDQIKQNYQKIIQENFWLQGEKPRIRIPLHQKN
jgi:hypothetical protein